MIERYGARAIALIIVAVIIVVLLIVGPASCQRLRSLAAQNRVNEAQGNAATASGSDAVGTQGSVNARASDSEATTRSNERIIRNAPGADAAVNPAVRDAGFASLCKRPAFRDSPTGRLRCPAAAGVAQGR